MLPFWIDCIDDATDENTSELIEILADKILIR